MADLNDEIFDIRVVERNIREGIISREDYNKYLSAMDDEAEESADTETRMEFFLEESSTTENEASPPSA